MYQKEFVRENNNTWELFRAKFEGTTIPYKVLACCPFKGNEAEELEKLVNKNPMADGYVEYIYKYALLENIITGAYVVAVDVNSKRFDGSKDFFNDLKKAEEYFKEKCDEYLRSIGVEVFKTSFVRVQDADSLAKQYEDYIKATSYGTYEITSEHVRALEDDMAEIYADEVSPYHLTFKREIGLNVYDMLLNRELDLIILI